MCSCYAANSQDLIKAMSFRLQDLWSVGELAFPKGIRFPISEKRRLIEGVWSEARQLA
jgi:hypothetical protein